MVNGSGVHVQALTLACIFINKDAIFSLGIGKASYDLLQRRGEDLVLMSFRVACPEPT